MKQKPTNETKKEIFALEKENLMLKKIISLMPGNVYWKNREGKYLGCNINTANILRLQPSDVIDKTVYDLFTKRLADPVQDTDEKIMNEGKAIYLEEEGLDFQGNSAIYLSHKVPLINENNEVEGLLGISLDISDRKKMEAQLKQLTEQAIEANRAKFEFLMLIENELDSAIHHLQNELDKLKGPVTNIENAKKICSDILKIVEDIGQFSAFDITKQTSLLDKTPMPQEKIPVAQLASLNLQNFKDRCKTLGLTNRETECMLYLVKGKSAKEMGLIMSLSYRTIEFYLDNSKRKVQCKTRSELVNKLISFLWPSEKK